MISTAIVLCAATFVNDNDPTMASNILRHQQYVRGLKQFNRCIKPWRDIVKIVFVDTTTTVLYSDIQEQLDGIVILKNDNQYGSKNKGAGVITQWKHAQSILQNYTWVIHFEPRVLLQDDTFFKNFFTNPETRFKYGSSKQDHFCTNLFSVKSKKLIEFMDKTNREEMVNQRVSIEYIIYDHFRSDALIVDVLRIVWNDAFTNTDIEM
jgi:hypothetical protein